MPPIKLMTGNIQGFGSQAQKTFLKKVLNIHQSHSELSQQCKLCKDEQISHVTDNQYSFYKATCISSREFCCAALLVYPETFLDNPW